MQRKNVLLNELSQYCMLLGIAEEREHLYTAQNRSLKLRETELIGKLGDAEHKALEQSTKVLTVELEIATLKADRDALQSRCNVLESEYHAVRTEFEASHRELTALQEALINNENVHSETVKKYYYYYYHYILTLIYHIIFISYLI